MPNEKIIKGGISKYLREVHNWKWREIWSVYEELRRFTSEF